MARNVNIRRSEAFTEGQLEKLRGDFDDFLKSSSCKDEITIVATGSYGRCEASEHSDLDLFVIFGVDEPPEDVIARELAGIDAIVRKHVPPETGSTGTFGTDAVISFANMASPIGGPEDTNIAMTRRMLFLLEGASLYGDDRFRDYQRKLLRRYLKPSSPQARIPRFLLNDIIRYYRTMTTDFEHKVSGQNKPWGLRNIKLRFSRKLIYFGGVVVAAELHDLDHESKIEKASELFSMPVLKRMAIVDGMDRAASVYQIYDQFIAALSNPSTREALKVVEKDSREESAEFQRLRALSGRFTDELHQWLTNRYSSDHPIHKALIF